MNKLLFRLGKDIVIAFVVSLITEVFLDRYRRPKAQLRFKKEENNSK